jgi:hypothetical protein
MATRELCRAAVGTNCRISGFAHQARAGPAVTPVTSYPPTTHHFLNPAKSDALPCTP